MTTRAGRSAYLGSAFAKRSMRKSAARQSAGQGFSFSSHILEDSAPARQEDTPFQALPYADMAIDAGTSQLTVALRLRAACRCESIEL